MADKPAIFRTVLAALYVAGLGASAYFLFSGASYYLTPIGNDYVFVFAGGELPYEFLRQCGVRFGGEDAQAS